jgi:hypothetical protein
VFVQVVPFAALYAVIMDEAQLIAATELSSTVPSDTTYDPVIEVPGDTPTLPTATVDVTPLKLTAVPPKNAKSAQLPRSIAEYPSA